MKDSIQFIELIVVGGTIHSTVLRFFFSLLCCSHSKVCLPVMLAKLQSNFLMIQYVATASKLCGHANVLDYWPNCVAGS